MNARHLFSAGSLVASLFIPAVASAQNCNAPQVAPTQAVQVGVPVQAYNAQPVYNTVPVYNAQPVYTTAPVYNAQPVYNTAPVYNTQPVYNRVDAWRQARFQAAAQRVEAARQAEAALAAQRAEMERTRYQAQRPGFVRNGRGGVSLNLHVGVPRR